MLSQLSSAIHQPAATPFRRNRQFQRLSHLGLATRQLSLPAAEETAKPATRLLITDETGGASRSGAARPEANPQRPEIRRVLLAGRAFKNVLPRNDLEVREPGLNDLLL